MGRTRQVTEPQKYVGVHLDESAFNRLEAAAQRAGTTRTGIVRRVVTRGLSIVESELDRAAEQPQAA